MAFTGYSGDIDWQTLKWDTGTLPTGTTATFKARACDKTMGQDGDCTSWQSSNLSPAGSLALDNTATGLQGRRFLQVEIILTSNSDNSATPQVDAVSVTYDQALSPSRMMIRSRNITTTAQVELR